ncbi:MAG: response regulator [Ignavibacteriaceae bacterium]|nr:response regulator [Ignavibacteriaceae bacterium]
MEKELKILMLEDVPEDAEIIEWELKHSGLSFTAKRVETESDFLDALSKFSPDLILADYLLPSFNALFALSDKKCIAPNIPFIVVTGSVSEDIAVECMKAGAEDYILKTNLKRLGPAVSSALKNSEMMKEKKLAERKILQLLRAVEQSPTAKIITDVEGNIEYVNPKFVELSGYSAEEVVGKNPRILKSGEMKSEDYKMLWNTISAGKTWKGDVHNRKKNGDLYWVSASISPIKLEDGTIINYVCNQEDITDKKRFLAELEIAKKLAEDSSQMKSHLLENLSHEFRTPLNGILGFSDIIEGEAENADMKDLARGIHKSGKRLLDTLTAILDLSQVDKEKNLIKLKHLNISSLINPITQEYSPIAVQRGLDFQININVGSYTVIADERFLTKSLSYIVDNAIKFTRNGKINVEVFPIEKEGLRFIQFDITDTGIGLSKENQSIIFKEFKQLSEGLGRGYEGIGIGLSLAKRMVEYLNGEITVKSKWGTGSTFSIIIPAEKKEKPLGDQILQQEKNEKCPETEKIKILSVEDNLENRTVITKFLYDSFEVDDAVNAIQAIQKAKSEKYALILMDISLDGAIDGRTAAKEIRKISGYENVPIIAITGYALFADKEQFLREGFNGYLAKPYRKNQLIEIINEHLNKA